jgi:hypothetical protein
MRISRKPKHCVVTWKGSENPQQGIEALISWGVHPKQIGKPNIKGLEVFVCPTRSDTIGLATLLQPFLTHPACPNRLVVESVETEEGRRWTDGMKRSVLQGRFTETTLPTFDGHASYFLHMYRIERTPKYHGKMELILEMNKGEHLTKGCLEKAKKAMTLLLLALCQVGGVEPQPIRQGGKGHQAGVLYCVKGRGSQVPTKEAATVAHRFEQALWQSWFFRGVWIEDEGLLLRRCLLLTVGKPLNRNRSAWFRRHIPQSVESEGAVYSSPPCKTSVSA